MYHELTKVTAGGCEGCEVTQPGASRGLSVGIPNPSNPSAEQPIPFPLSLRRQGNPVGCSPLPRFPL